MAILEKFLEKTNSDPDYLTLSVQLIGIMLSQRMEVYLVL
jgi:hypothetical protein